MFIVVVQGQLCPNSNERYDACGAKCQLNCSNYQQNPPCILICAPGCVCKTDYVRKTDNSSPCVKKVDCE
ncbi:hypothetical protein LAZ67_16002717 [Cordylochernes scorpioides]|uniref:TIL domain-containing protein n=1 Tax=Cordylochernes scorpioides TaxID=51811 RepID=A0ABY6LFV8_9ARAC|nr:hypothetical protein LAZ67_16002717 [Cordylochernes scorpioides]